MNPVSSDMVPDDGVEIGAYRWRVQAEMARSLTAAAGVRSRVCRMDDDRFALLVADLDVTAARQALGLTLPPGSPARAEMNRIEDDGGHAVELAVAALIAVVVAVALVAVMLT